MTNISRDNDVVELNAPPFFNYGEKVRAALPFHTHLTKDQVEFIVATMKDASVNVGAGAAIF
jgi:hypothetical protein